MSPKTVKPEISIEWLDVSIDIKVIVGSKKIKLRVRSLLRFPINWTND